MNMYDTIVKVAELAYAHPWATITFLLTIKLRRDAGFNWFDLAINWIKNRFTTKI